jgi:hypothetical protein
VTDHPGERVQGGAGIWIGGGEHGTGGAAAVQGSQLLVSSFLSTHDGEAIDPAIGEGGRERSRRCGASAQLSEFGGELEHGHVRLPVRFPDDRQGLSHPLPGHGRVVVDGGEVVRDDLVIRGMYLLDHRRQVFRCHRLGENGSLRNPAGQPE